MSVKVVVFNFHYDQADKIIRLAFFEDFSIIKVIRFPYFEDFAIPGNGLLTSIK